MKTNTQVQLSSQQEQAVEAALSLVGSGRSGAIVGGAGTGKTTLVRAICAATNVELLAPSHKAAARLRELTEQDANTIHSATMICTSHNDNHGGRGRGRGVFDPIRARETGDLKFTDAGKSTEADLVLVDEAGMVDAKFVRVVESYAGGAGIVWIGDPHQLKPVACNNSALDVVPVMVELSEVHRQRAGLVLDVATAIRNGANIAQQLMRLPTATEQDVLDADMVLCGKHKTTRNDLTNYIRQTNGFDTHDIERMEPLIVLQKLVYGDHEHYLQDEVTFRGWDGDERRFEFENPDKSTSVIGLRRAAVQTTNGAIDIVLLQTTVTDFDWDRVYGYGQKEKGAFDRFVVDPQRKYKEKEGGRWAPILLTEFGYTRTVPAAQGSEWDDVVVVGEDHVGDSRRWHYTAITRAKSRCTIYRD